METHSNLQIIRPELDNFARDIGHKSETGEPQFFDNPTFNKLFCRVHKDSIWFDQGKFYKVTTRESKISLYEVGAGSHFIEKNQNGVVQSSLFWAVVLLLAFFTSDTPYFPLVLFVIIISLMEDILRNFYYGLRIKLFHR